MVRLLVTAGPAEGRTVELEGELLIGRGNVAVSIDDRQLSRRHARVAPAPEGVTVEDLDSLNGTWVDGVRVTGSVTVSPGHAIRMGRTVLEVEPPPPAQPEQRLPAFGQLSPTGAAGVSPLRRRAPATRLWLPTVLTVAVIVATAVALVVYFAAR
jgi:DNA segregation ATPase FtsK/SpoIIIE, S-DNA-T family